MTTAQRWRLPALIIRAPFAVAAVSGVPVGAKRVVKQFECRGKRLATEYRGAVAIFASRNRQADDETVIEDVFRHNGHKAGAAGEASRFCAACDVWRYRLVGFVKLFDVATAEQVASATVKDQRAIHALAFDFAAAWQVETYLCLEPLHALAVPGVLFNEACAGCLALPPHNISACHVGWQTVELSCVPPVVAAEIRPWPLRK